jgi:hypothetical protein
MSFALLGRASGWPGAALLRSDDSGNTWPVVGAMNNRARVFEAGAALSAHHGYSPDYSAVLTVTPVTPDAELYSVTEEQFYSESNLAAYGADGRWEIVAFKTAVDNTGTFTLRDFLRGLYGSEWASGLHQSGDLFIMLDTSTLGFFGLPINALGSQRLYRAVTQGATIDSAPTITDTYDGNNIKPLSVIDVRGSRSPFSFDWTVSVSRRTRWPVELFSGQSVPIGESIEAYSLDIFNSDYSEIKRTLTSSDGTFTYSLADQILDFGAKQATVYFDVCQNSTVAGRGLLSRNSLFRFVGEDPYSDSVVALLHFNGANGSTTFTDETGKTFTPNGNAQISTAQSKFGGASGYLDGTGDWVYSDHADYNPGSGDFTMEAWIRPTSTALTNSGIFQLSSTSGGFATTNRGIVMAFNSGGGGMSISYAGVDQFISYTFTADTWYHVAVCRSGSSLRYFINGSLVSTKTDSTNYSGLRYLVLGGYYSSTYVMQGYFEEFRFSKCARYTAAFTSPTAAFPYP